MPCLAGVVLCSWLSFGLYPRHITSTARSKCCMLHWWSINSRIFLTGAGGATTSRPTTGFLKAQDWQCCCSISFFCWTLFEFWWWSYVRVTQATSSRFGRPLEPRLCYCLCSASQIFWTWPKRHWIEVLWSLRFGRIRHISSHLFKGCSSQCCTVSWTERYDFWEILHTY